MTLTKARNEVVAQAAASFYEGLTTPEQIAFDDYAEALRNTIKRKMPNYIISTVTLREAAFALLAVDVVQHRPGYSRKDHLTRWLNL